ncbi:YgjP-like metallopeptidase domain-containing protein [Geomesophilobacter sediminis]|uniref:DUF45 domain-containing protein n=1 Tax=Geomesophilobacter sediminis TaxID=2798584 RepID=A0A8J7M2G7_9BACT|nr:YgjP-like metallopeptidase domain-containing protein [Geomesophilobacter sediminis]MBJ6727171.1 DUF45 domain-containing protein [Geomesophilobacter sediminis]
MPGHSSRDWTALHNRSDMSWRSRSMMHVKLMKTKRGTCSVEARRIWLNLELVKKPIYCLEYIIVHELVHLLELLHTDRFTALMDQPMWWQYREELNRAPLAQGGWEY